MHMETCCSSAPNTGGLSRRGFIGALGLSAVVAGVSRSAADAATPPGLGSAGSSSGEPGISEFGPFELILLGTKSGPPVDAMRAGISSAVVVDGVTYIVDCGRGSTTQFERAGLKIQSLRSIFITHLHADHVADYYNYFLLAGNQMVRPVSVYGPGSAGGLPPKFGGGDAPVVAPENPTPGLADLTNRCHEAFAYSSNVFVRDTGFGDIRSLVEVHEIELPAVGASYRDTSPTMDPFLVMEDDRVRVSAILVPHGPVFPAFAFRFDTAYGSVTFSGDTTYSDNLVHLATGSDILVHEALNLQGSTLLSPVAMDHMLQSHVEVQKVGHIAQRAGVSTLVLSHIADFATAPDDLDPAQWKKWAGQGFDGKVIVGSDLMQIRV